MSVLVIDQNVKDSIQELVSFAEKNVFTVQDLVDIKVGKMPSPGNLKGYSLVIPIGYRVVYSLEHQPKYPGKVFRHISISRIETERKVYPNPDSVQAILDEFGFKMNFKNGANLSKGYMWMEECERAINILEMIE